MCCVNLCVESESMAPTEPERACNGLRDRCILRCLYKPVAPLCSSFALLKALVLTHMAPIENRASSFIGQATCSIMNVLLKEQFTQKLKVVIVYSRYFKCGMTPFHL